MKGAKQFARPEDVYQELRDVLRASPWLTPDEYERGLLRIIDTPLDQLEDLYHKTVAALQKREEDKMREAENLIKRLPEDSLMRQSAVLHFGRGMMKGRALARFVVNMTDYIERLERNENKTLKPYQRPDGRPAKGGLS